MMLKLAISHFIQFPGLGIGEFKLDPVAFRIPLPWSDEPHPVMWYGIIVTLAMVLGFMVALKCSKHEQIKKDDMLDLAIYLIIFCILGARLYYVLFYPGNYDSFKDVIAIWEGGLAIYGGVLAGIATIVVFTKIKKINSAKLLDAAAPGLILGQVIGRWGNFCNAEAHGGETEFFLRMGIRSENQTAATFVHPTFLYESLWNLLGFAIIMALYKKKKFNGQMALFYGIWYGAGRYVIEGMRTDSLMLGNTDIRVSQLVAAICVVGGIIAMIVCGKIANERRMETEDYEEVYATGKKLPGFDDEAAFDIKAEPDDKAADDSSEENNEPEENKPEQSETEKEN